MRYFPLISLLFLLIFCLLTSQGKLEIHIKDSRQGIHTFIPSEVKVYRGKELIEVLPLSVTNPQIIENISPGKYRLTYTSIFKQEKAESVLIFPFFTQKVILHPGKLNHKEDGYPPILDRLQESECYAIEMQSLGCFHSMKAHLWIYKANRKYYAEYEGKVKELSSVDLEAIRRFEIELNHIGSNGCTTVDYYRILYKDTEVLVADGSCMWEGFSYLLLDLELNS
ncbi:MAG: hypothetical protein AAFP83_10635 [Bacteroidota bacterium]